MEIITIAPHTYVDDSDDDDDGNDNGRDLRFRNDKHDLHVLFMNDAKKRWMHANVHVGIEKAKIIWSDGTITGTMASE